jgi:hypothetical protein
MGIRTRALDQEPVASWTAGWQRRRRPLSERDAEPGHASKPGPVGRPMWFCPWPSLTAAAAAMGGTMGEGAAGQRVKQPLTPTRELR